MVCEHCKQRHANITVTQVQNGQKLERHYCEVCASQFHPFQFDVQEEPVSLQQFITNWFSAPFKANVLEEKQVQGERKSCPSCQLTYAEFLKQGKFGCAMCYSTFRKQLPPLFEKLHTGTTHVTNHEVHLDTSHIYEEKISHLRVELKRAIEEERFEDAAKLRDEVRVLETKIQSGIQSGGGDTP